MPSFADGAGCMFFVSVCKCLFCKTLVLWNDGHHERTLIASTHNASETTTLNYLSCLFRKEELTQTRVRDEQVTLRVERPVVSHSLTKRDLFLQAEAAKFETFFLVIVCQVMKTDQCPRAEYLPYLSAEVEQRVLGVSLSLRTLKQRAGAHRPVGPDTRPSKSVIFFFHFDHEGPAHRRNAGDLIYSLLCRVSRRPTGVERSPGSELFSCAC